MNISRYLDHAVLKPNLTEQEVRDAIQAGIDHRVYSVCVRPCDIDLAREMCEGTDTLVTCVLDFPHGDSTEEGKAALAELYAAKGVAEIDMVMNYGYARSGKWDAVAADVAGVVEAGSRRGVAVKVILETCCLTLGRFARAPRFAPLRGRLLSKPPQALPLREPARRRCGPCWKPPTAGSRSRLPAESGTMPRPSGMWIWAWIAWAWGLAPQR